MKVRVIRPLCVAGVRKEVGEIVDLYNAAEAIQAGRAERMPEETPASAGPMTTESTPGLMPGKKRKNAQKGTEDVVS